MGKICMNEACKKGSGSSSNNSDTSLDWKNGWVLKSGGFATLCYSCGSVYENSLYCETFHVEESGWRECRICGKRMHCGCIVSKNLHDYLDFGGIGCLGCLKKLENQPPRPLKVNGDTPNGFSPRPLINVSDPQSSKVEHLKEGIEFDKGKPIQLDKAITKNDGLMHLSKAMVENNTPTLQIKQEGKTSCLLGKPATYPAVNFSMAGPFGTPNNIEVKKPVTVGRSLPFQLGEMASQKLLKADAIKETVSETRVARPPAEGRGRNQLLPRYWPRITDQELQQISGDLNSTIVPLFEKVLSASDAGRIGRLVLPKACAEAYFPPIFHSEGLPIKVQDIKGKEWKFQFRFWPNNNSRMYVLEGVTPCIQNMQLQAGDTVTFSRIDPGGNLVIGFRKSSNSGDMQDGQPSALLNGTGSGETSLPGANDNLPTDGSKTNDGIPHQKNLTLGKKKTRNIGSKNKRLHMHSEDAMELRLTWDEAQELLRPSPGAKPNIVMIENHVFEEYEEPPVFGKRTIFTAGASGNQEQWAQCDSCFKWRKLPVDFLVPPKWTCSENIWDSSRCSCDAIGEMDPTELERFLRVGRELKTRRVIESPYSEQDHEPSGLDALATAAFLGENTEGPGEPSTGPTTRHPRHRPGCTCIVCIQPPSGKGRHKPTCICNVCLTVKRRFKTLMLRKKIRQSEREEELALEREKAKQLLSTDDVTAVSGVGNGFPFKSLLEDEKSQSKSSALDLNCDPNREEEVVEQRTVLVTCSENGITKPSTSECHPPEKELSKQG